MVVCVFGVVIGMMRFRVVVGMVVFPRSMTVRVGMDDDFSGRVAAAAILSADDTGSLALGALFGLVGDVLCGHKRLLSNLRSARMVIPPISVFLM